MRDDDISIFRFWPVIVMGLSLLLLTGVPVRAQQAQIADPSKNMRPVTDEMLLHPRAVQRSIHDAHGEDCTDAAEGDAMPTI